MSKSRNALTPGTVRSVMVRTNESQNKNLNNPSASRSFNPAPTAYSPREYNLSQNSEETLPATSYRDLTKKSKISATNYLFISLLIFLCIAVFLKIADPAPKNEMIILTPQIKNELPPQEAKVPEGSKLYYTERVKKEIGPGGRTSEVVEKIEYKEPAPVEVQQNKIVVDAPTESLVIPDRKYRFEVSLVEKEIRKKYDRIRRHECVRYINDQDSYRRSNHEFYRNHSYDQIRHRYNDNMEKIRAEEYDEVCKVTGDSFRCDYAAKFREALEKYQGSYENGRIPASIDN